MQSRISKNLDGVKTETLYVGIDLGLDRNEALVERYQEILPEYVEAA